MQKADPLLQGVNSTLNRRHQAAGYPVSTLAESTRQSLSLAGQKSDLLLENVNRALHG